MQTKHTLYIGDSRDMSRLNGKTVHLIVTSPPYWQLKDYEHEGQIGFHDSYEEYINNLNQVWMESYRVLHPGCRLCVNIGDQFARSAYYGRYKVIPIRTEITRFCETVGFDYMGAVIWQKVTTCNTTGGATIMGSFPYPRNGILKLDYEFILLFKKPGAPPKISEEQKQASAMTKEEWNTFFQGHWTFSGAKQSGHVAVFPEELPRRLIKMFSFVGDTVLDPFAGSGTTSYVASLLDRNSVAYEINPEFAALIRERFVGAEPSLFSETRFEEVALSRQEEAISRNRERLPYLFSDPVQMERKADPKQLTFGSRISHKQKEHAEDILKVSDVVTPVKLMINGNMPVRLLGVRCNPQKVEAAVQFLRHIALNQRVALKFDAVTYDENDTLLAYVYLSNKTFLNAHLIKQGFATVDNSIHFKYHDRFNSFLSKGE